MWSLNTGQKSDRTRLLSDSPAWRHDSGRWRRSSGAKPVAISWWLSGFPPGPRPGGAPGTPWPSGNGNCVDYVCETSGDTWPDIGRYYEFIRTNWQRVPCDDAQPGCLTFVLDQIFRKVNGGWAPQGRPIAIIHVAKLVANGQWKSKPGFKAPNPAEPAPAARLRSERGITTPEPFIDGDVHMHPGFAGVPNGSLARGTRTVCYCPPD